VSFPRYPEYKDSRVEWLGEVPSGWESLALKRIVDRQRAITYGIVQAGPHDPDGVPYIRPADMGDERGIEDPDDMLKTSPEIALSYARSTVRKGDLICSIGPSYGKVMVVPNDLDGANLTQGTARIAVAGPNVARFYFWVLRSRSSVAQWESSVGGATFRALNLGPLAETIVTRPPSKEQQVIAAFLDRETAKIDALVAEQEMLIALLHEKRQAVISHAVTKGLDPNVPMKDSGVGWLGEVPAHWKVVQLKRAVMFQRGHDLPEESRSEGNIPVVSSAGVIGTHNAAQAKGPGIVTGRYGSIGRFTLMEEDYWPLNTALYSIELYSNQPRYIWYLLQSTSEHFVLNSLKSAVPGVDRNDIHCVQVAVPARCEQEEIALFLDRQCSISHQLVKQVQAAIDLLQERRAALISAAVTGQIDVRHLNLTDASRDSAVCA